MQIKKELNLLIEKESTLLSYKFLNKYCIVLVIYLTNKTDTIKMLQLIRIWPRIILILSVIVIIYFQYSLLIILLFIG